MTHFLNLFEILSRQTCWPSFMIIRLKMWLLELTQGFTRIWSGDLVFDPTWPIFELVRNFIKMNILTKFHEKTEMWPLQHIQGFSKIWPSDLVFDPTLPIFELVWYFIKTYNLKKFPDNRIENVASGAYTRFF